MDEAKRGFLRLSVVGSVASISNPLPTEGQLSRKITLLSPQFVHLSLLCLSVCLCVCLFLSWEGSMVNSSLFPGVNQYIHIRGCSFFLRCD